jgi:hypothetical protein
MFLLGEREIHLHKAQGYLPRGKAANVCIRSRRVQWVLARRWTTPNCTPRFGLPTYPPSRAKIAQPLKLKL